MPPSRRTKKKTAATGTATSGGGVSGGVGGSVSGGVSAVIGASTAADSAVPMEGTEEVHVTATAPAAAAAAVVEGQREDDENDRAEEKCPACKDGAMTELAGDKETWIQCDACKTWFHWDCAGNGGDAQQVDKWYCASCMTENPSRMVTLKPAPTRKSSRKSSTKAVRVPTDAGGDTPMLDAGPTTSTTIPSSVPTTPSVPAPPVSVPRSGLTPVATTMPPDLNKWITVAQSKPYKPDTFRRMKGYEVGQEWIYTDPKAMTEPVVIEVPEGLGMNMPSKEYTIRDVATDVGPDTPLEVIDVMSQSTSPNWTLGKWADYYHSPATERDKIRNVISLEVSGSPLGTKILPPRFVREIDWVEKFWPPNKRIPGQYPKVQLYCLMSVAQCWTDWHIDFAGSSVYYHILRGSKIFYFIRPTPANLAAYEHWSGTSIQNSIWLGDMCDEVVKVELTEGNTMIIPTGWIHAVYTPVDTLVFGGNFLHSLNIGGQLRCRDIEIRTRVPKKFRFPFLTKLCWYAGEKYLRDLKAKDDLPPRILRSLDALARFLVAEARVMEKGTEAAKREAKEQVPYEKIKDPSSLARELRWRVRAAAGVDSGDELEDETGAAVKEEAANGAMEVEPSTQVGNVLGKKRRRQEAKPIFRNWQPPEWEKVETVPTRETLANFSVEEDAEGWMKGEGLAGQVKRTLRVNEVSKIRRLGNGTIERYRVVRTVEYVVPGSVV